jgi:lactoylglutathione lyase
MRKGGRYVDPNKQKFPSAKPVPEPYLTEYVKAIADLRAELDALPTTRFLKGPMRYLHTMIRVRDLDAALDFFVKKLGLVETRRKDNEKGRFTLVFLAETPGAPELELTHNWDQDGPYTVGRNFGHVAYEVDDLYATCQRLLDRGVVLNRPPRDGHMAFIRSPDLVSVELLQKGPALPVKEPWASMPSVGEW